MRAVREVEPRDTHPGAEELLEDLDAARLGAEGADDLFCFVMYFKTLSTPERCVVSDMEREGERARRREGGLTCSCGKLHVFVDRALFRRSLFASLGRTIPSNCLSGACSSSVAALRLLLLRGSRSHCSACSAGVIKGESRGKTAGSRRFLPSALSSHSEFVEREREIVRFSRSTPDDEREKKSPPSPHLGLGEGRAARAGGIVRAQHALEA